MATTTPDPLALPGIRPDLAAARGYRVLDAEEAASELPALGFADYQAALGGGLLVPMFDVRGVNGSFQFRPDAPRLHDGKPIKYETPQGARNMLDVHPSMVGHIVHPETALVITEGVKKADSITSLGCLTGALAGVYSWRTKDADGNSITLPEFDTIPWDGREVYLVWDSDATTNPDVMNALRGLRDDLAGRGARVIALIPPSADGTKVGVDDFLAAGGEWGGLLPLDLDFKTPLISSAGFVQGDEFFLDVPVVRRALWGSGQKIVWAWGEPFMIGALQGLGKTSDALQLGFGLLGIKGFEELYGLPITPLPEDQNLVYLALDRPHQIAHAGARLMRGLGEADKAIIAQRFRPWKGPLPFNVTTEPEKLRPWLQEQSAGAFFIDSLKDVMTRLSDEEQAAMVMRAVQECIAYEIQTGILQHIRKPNADNKKPKTLADIHGSDNISRGCGSVITLWAPAAGATEVELNHVKPPAEPVGPFVIQRDHTSGRSTRERTGVLANDALSVRKAAILAHFREAGGVGVRRTWKQLTEAGLGSTSTLRPAMADLKNEAWLAPVANTEGGAGHEVEWEMLEKIV